MHHTQDSSVNQFDAKTFESNGVAQLDDENKKLHVTVEDLNRQLEEMDEENRILKATLDETQQELEGLVNEHEELSNKYTDQQNRLKEAAEKPGKLR